MLPEQQRLLGQRATDVAQEQYLPLGSNMGGHLQSPECCNQIQKQNPKLFLDFASPLDAKLDISTYNSSAYKKSATYWRNSLTNLFFGYCFLYPNHGTNSYKRDCCPSHSSPMPFCVEAGTCLTPSCKKQLKQLSCLTPGNHGLQTEIGTFLHPGIRN